MSYLAIALALVVLIRLHAVSKQNDAIIARIDEFVEDLESRYEITVSEPEIAVTQEMFERLQHEFAHLNRIDYAPPPGMRYGVDPESLRVTAEPNTSEKL